MKEKENTRVRMPKITATRPLLHVSAPTHSPQGTREGKGPLDDDKCRWEQENAAGQFLRVRGVGGSYTGVSSLSKAAQWGCRAWNLLPRITTPLPPVQYPNTHHFSESTMVSPVPSHFKSKPTPPLCSQGPA